MVNDMSAPYRTRTVGINRAFKNKVFAVLAIFLMIATGFFVFNGDSDVSAEADTTNVQSTVE